MTNRIAATICPKCDWNTAYWEPIEHEGYLIGNMFTCTLCGHINIVWR